ncbi:MAG: cytochrome b N-terminal domain-containing protein [Acidimicrobiales bacterium]
MPGSSSLFGAVFDLNGPGRYLHWSIFQVSEANLVLIAAMVVIFGLALLLPFPGKHDRTSTPGTTTGAHTPGPGTRTVPDGAPDAPGTPAQPAAAGSRGAHARARSTDPSDTSDMWTARVRNLALSLLPPGKLLPDHQPAYVASWIYVFGVATIAALGLAIASGFAIAVGGADWWHTNVVGHFFNSMHMWSVELFMAFMVIHLWGKFWMAAWRGRRALTWMTGVLAFGASVVECFTGYLSQQNFDSQWVSTNGKDAINATGLGAFFNLLNFGQMLLWHVVLLPLVLVAIVGAHVLLVRVRGVSHPLPKERPRLGRAGATERRALARADAADWHGPTKRYDILKEATVASSIVLVLVLLLAGILSSPDEPPVTIASWAKVAPADFLGTAATELAGTSETATYGPPYNNGNAFVQKIVVSWQRLSGVHEAIEPATTFVLSPLSKVASTEPRLASSLAAYERATSAQRNAWDAAYIKALDHLRFSGGEPVLPAAADGPVPVLLTTELTLARSGALDADLIANQAFYGSNFTAPLLFLEDGQYFSSVAQARHMTGSQWGVMNETGSYPGQPWLWLYTLWYQLPGFRSSSNVDLIAVYLTGAATLLLLGVPFVPGIRDIPRVVPLHRRVWRRWE